MGKVRSKILCLRIGVKFDVMIKPVRQIRLNQSANGGYLDFSNKSLKSLPLSGIQWEGLDV